MNKIRVSSEQQKGELSQMSFIDDQFDDYLNYGIAEEDYSSCEYDEDDGNERLNKYYSRSYGARTRDNVMDLYR